ncbi:hypothetical protein [Kordiimonas gwangyangensis]|uniref:hypothetical protein n=1 Tax=Kordiimonas gwangyangensis TaxID=288022 RepID=UPI00036EB1E8|nr:hypothetical protein [Kordiimonas gwangyangensis]
MKLYQRKKRIQAMSQIAQAQPNPYEAMSHDELVQAGRAAGLPPFCGGWPRETIINKIMETAHGN